ncbi:MAG: hemerythrin domain-containing protein [Rhodoferax sp.]|uniref:hemerythrin domain-containing protein n=1 Tax=Rhodoferax sp. TaxID=50421 RepID=UPI00261558E0|nr:hemerythrin domain-containing protein [Rhodoferax sp.]MDD5332610.1 hemerythrin domain-containing protein [Rhodoferax sp.]
MLHQSIQIIRDEHAVLAALLRSLEMMLERGAGNEPENYFDALRAMLFYIDEFPERQHHPKESELLFPRVARLVPETQALIARLDQEHASGEAAVRELQHLLLAWQLLGESRRAAFAAAAKRYLAFYLEHLRLEETVILPAALKVLSAADWQELDAAFATNCDPLTGKYPRDPAYDQLFTRIVSRAPAPIGLG